MICALLRVLRLRFVALLQGRVALHLSSVALAISICVRHSSCITLLQGRIALHPSSAALIVALEA
jgi:hypothetical protein